jgi:hypothetical protein
MQELSLQELEERFEMTVSLENDKTSPGPVAGDWPSEWILR